jgi:hypothetical protein
LLPLPLIELYAKAYLCWHIAVNRKTDAMKIVWRIIGAPVKNMQWHAFPYAPLLICAPGMKRYCRSEFFHQTEYEALGLTLPAAHEERYVYAQEWFDLVKMLCPAQKPSTGTDGISS